jgi:coenzyme PQQ biosynthesis protein C
VKLLSPDELEAALRDIGAKRYHRLHPFHALLHGGKCSKGQVQAWALNRYYYQAMIPIKDASLIARCEDSAVRREWRSRLVDHDGEREGDGGIARWLKLTDGLGLERGYVTSLRGILPGTRFTVEAYVHFVREKTLLEAIASSLTEMFSPVIISERRKRSATPTSRSISSSAMRGHRNSSRRCLPRSNSNAAFSGRCSTRFTTPTYRRDTFRQAPSCRRIDDEWAGDAGVRHLASAPATRRAVDTQ